ncbi:CLUMA_CG012604, isoform A [Clunio marinus]|uniref:CLUMA_CG012604, isoform A n=1 Tax=Clunio marinus TaxID=568069 RepID=A0A1J1IGK8_9DIPT|nr:CLUMA_CG012604, isoform A [Clunio marinus]
MNNKGNELSIFQGGPSIHVDNNRQRIEEEEALQDQIRRNVELNNDLQNAFEDFEEEEDVDESVNSTKYSQENSYHQHHHSNGNRQQYRAQQPFQFQFRSEETRCKNVLESKIREIEFVTNQLKSERKQHKNAIDEYEKRLSVAEAEKERALMTRDQMHELLVENKSKLIETEEDNQKHCSKIKFLESENSALIGELEGTKLMLSDIQVKYSMVEKNVKFNAERNTDSILKQAQERHTAQIAMMQQQVDGLKAKYDDIEHDHKNLEIRYKELQRSRESMLIEKSEMINQLNKNLEDAQRQCKDLLSRPDLTQENRQLQSLIHSMELQRKDMKETINTLHKRLEDQTLEMEMMDSIVHECGGNNTSYSECSKFTHKDPLKSKNNGILLGPQARLIWVKDELCKSLNNIKSKRENIKIMEKQLIEKDEEIKKISLNENKALAQLNHYRVEASRLESKTRILEKELNNVSDELNELRKTRSNPHCITNEKYEEIISNLQKEKEPLEMELHEIKTDFENMIMKNSVLSDREKDLQMTIAYLEKELKKLQNHSSSIGDLEKREREKVQKLPEDLERLQLAEMKVDKGTQIEDLSDKVKRNCQNCEENLTKLEQKSTELEVRGEQLKLLKFTIIQEREESEAILRETENGFESSIEKYRLRYEDNLRHTEEMTRHLNEKKELINEERISIECLKKQIHEERKLLLKREEETLEKVGKLEQENRKAIGELNEKYLSAKKTAINYKQYSEDKEKHFRNECERIKSSCIQKISKAEQCFKETLMKKEKGYQERLTKIEADFEAKVGEWNHKHEKHE